MAILKEAQEWCNKHAGEWLSGTIEMPEEYFSLINEEAERKLSEIIAADREWLAEITGKRGDELKEHLDAEITNALNSSDLNKADTEAANIFATDKINDTLTAGVTVCYYGLEGKEQIIKTYGVPFFESLNLPEDHILKDYCVKITQTANSIQVEADKAHKNLINNVKEGLSEFVHKFSKDKSEAKQNLGERAANGIENAFNSIKSTIGQAFKNADAIVKETSEKLATRARQLGHDAVYKDAVFLPAVLAKIHEEQAKYKEQKAEVKAFIDDLVNNKGYEKHEAVWEYLKHDMKKNLAETGKEIQARIDEFKEMPVFKFPGKVADKAREIKDNVSKGIDNAWLAAEIRRQDMNKAFEQKVAKLIEGGTKRWAQAKEFGKDATDKISMAIAAEKMKESLRKDFHEINKKYNNDIRSIKRQVAKDVVADIAEIKKEEFTELKENFKNTKEIDDKIKAAKEALTAVEKLGNETLIEMSRKELQALESQREALMQNKEQITKTAKADIETVKETAKEKIGEKVEQVKTYKNDEIDKAIDKLNASKEAQKARVEIKRESDTKVAIRKADPNTKNYVDTVEKANVVENLSNASRVESKILSKFNKPKEAVQKINEAEQTRQSYTSIIGAMKQGLINLKETFKKEDAEAIAKASSDVKMATDDLKLDFLDNQGTFNEYVSKAGYLDDLVKRTNELTKQAEYQREITALREKEGKNAFLGDNGRYAILQKTADENFGKIADVAKEPEMQSASFIDRCNDQTVGIYNLDMSKGDNGYLRIVEGESIKKALMDMAKGMGYSDEAINKVAQLATSLDDKPGYSVEVKAVDNMLNNEPPVLCVSATSPSMEQINIIIGQDASEKCAVKRNLNEEFTLMACSTIFGKDNDGHAYADLSLVENGVSKDVLVQGNVKDVANNFVHEAEAAKEQGVGKENSPLTMDDINKAFD